MLSSYPCGGLRNPQLLSKVCGAVCSLSGEEESRTPSTECRITIDYFKELIK